MTCSDCFAEKTMALYTSSSVSNGRVMGGRFFTHACDHFALGPLHCEIDPNPFPLRPKLRQNEMALTSFFSMAHPKV